VKKIRTLIVDDELAARNVISNLLELSFSQIDIIDKVGNVPDAVLSIKKYKPDLVFLDIEMPKYAGYELVKFFDEIDFQIIFVTAYNQFAIKAFEINAVDYLLKPIERKRLESAIIKAESRISDKHDSEKYQALLEELSVENSPSMTLSESGKKQIVRTKEIEAVSAQGAYSEVYLLNGSKITISKNVGTMEEELSNDPNFFRSHKSWLINISQVESYAKSNQTILLKSGLECKLSRFKKKDFEEIVENL
jgi:two-component system LytT family response regulator